MDYLNLALSYGGYTSLDKVYLERVLAGLTEEQKLQCITPPPSVINAYFAELYQKRAQKQQLTTMNKSLRPLISIRHIPALRRRNPLSVSIFRARPMVFATERRDWLKYLHSKQKPSAWTSCLKSRKSFLTTWSMKRKA